LRRCRGGEGAARSPVLDCFSFFRYRVFSVTSMTLVIMFYFSGVLLVRCIPPTSF
jgi:hypothetical protein